MSETLKPDSVIAVFDRPFLEECLRNGLDLEVRVENIEDAEIQSRLLAPPPSADLAKLAMKLADEIVNSSAENVSQFPGMILSALYTVAMTRDAEIHSNQAHIIFYAQQLEDKKVEIACLTTENERLARALLHSDKPSATLEPKGQADGQANSPAADQAKG